MAWLTALSHGQLSVVSPLGSLSSAFTVVFVLAIDQSVANAVWIGLGRPRVRSRGEVACTQS
jgi:uncharacterized membrane protein